MSETIQKNDCIFCENEIIGRSLRIFCDYYGKDIHMPSAPGDKGPFRQQRACQGFRFKPGMVVHWDREFRKER